MLNCKLDNALFAVLFSVIAFCFADALAKLLVDIRGLVQNRRVGVGYDALALNALYS